MSGPKVHRIATVEEVLDYCRGLLAQLASWRGKVGSLVLLVRLRSQLCFSAGTRYVPWRPCKGRHTSTSRCRARSRSLPRTWTRESRRRPRKRRKSAPRAGASPAPQPHWLRHWPKAAPAFPQNCKLPCRPCAMVRPRRRRGGRAGALPGLCPAGACGRGSRPRRAPARDRTTSRRGRGDTDARRLAARPAAARRCARAGAGPPYRRARSPRRGDGRPPLRGARPASRGRGLAGAQTAARR